MQVCDWDGRDKELVIVPSPDMPPAELRQEVRGPAEEVSVSFLHEVSPQPQSQPQPQPLPSPGLSPSPSLKPNQVPAGGGEKLRALLAARGLSRHVALLDERGFVHGEWFADYALAVLSPNSGCSSEPSWVAWVAWQPAQPEAAAAPTLTLTVTLTPTLPLTLTLTLSRPPPPPPPLPQQRRARAAIC